MVKICIACSEEQELIAKGLCGRCYMRERRATEAANLRDLWAQPKKHDVEKRRFQKRARKALNSMLDNVDTLESPPFLDLEVVSVFRFEIKTALMRSAQGMNPEFTPEQKPSPIIVLAPALRLPLQRLRCPVLNRRLGWRRAGKIVLTSKGRATKSLQP
jgi:hypothetical protein